MLLDQAQTGCWHKADYLFSCEVMVVVVVMMMISH